MRDKGLEWEVRRFDADSSSDERKDVLKGYALAVALSTLFWVGIGYAIWSRL
jgi:hypothetical protein